MVLLRNVGLLSLSFLMSALVNVVPQQFFSAAAPDTKQAWLASTLVVGTLASLLGVEVARRVGFGRHARRNALLTVLATAALTLVQLHVAHVGVHLLLHAVVRGLGNHLTQEIDRRTVVLAGLGDRSANDRIGTALRFGGMLLGPLWFSTADGRGAWTLVVLAALCVLLLASVVTTSDAHPSQPNRQSTAPLGARARLLVAAAVAIYASYYLLASSITYVLMDLHRVPDAKAAAGLMITMVYGSAIAASVLMTPLLRGGLHTAWMVVAPGCMAVAGLFLGSRVAVIPVVTHTGAVVLGVAFALFMLAFRNHATRQAALGEEGWVAVFNNFGNTSSLLGFGLMALLVTWEQTPSASIPLGVTALALTGLLCTVLALRRPKVSAAGSAA